MPQHILKWGKSAAVYCTRDRKFHQAVSGREWLPTSSWDPEQLSSAKGVTTWVQLLWGRAQPASGCGNPYVAQPWSALPTHPASICSILSSPQHN